jgi:hypothetical protein
MGLPDTGRAVTLTLLAGTMAADGEAWTVVAVSGFILFILITPAF